MKMVVFTGAGASAELGVPTMRPMFLQFCEHLEERDWEGHILSTIQELAKNEDYDIENLVEELDNLEQSVTTWKKWDAAVEHPLSKNVGPVRAEAEWFIQHICEQVASVKAYLMWSAVLRSFQNHDVTIATTNYDRAIEIAAARSGIQFADGFAEFEGREWAGWCGFGQTVKSVKLLKLHGSTDWYHAAGNDSVWKLQHATPLFGRVSLYLDRPGQELTLKNAAVLPSREKKITEVPYPALNFEFQKSLKEAEAAFFIGSSLRDPDIRSMCRDCAEKMPTFVISRNAQQGDEHAPPDAHIVRQTASQFLVSTLPPALRTSSADTLLEKINSSTQESESILDYLSITYDETKPVQERCPAIERLASARVSLDRVDVGRLLEDKDPDIRRYALGLIGNSPDRDDLVKFAQDLSSKNSDSDFQNETELLVQLLSQESP